MKNKYDVIIVGTGVAGCFAALHFPASYSVLLITKSELEESDSFLAQGGISVKRDDDDTFAFTNDTLKAGHNENDLETVEIMVNTSPRIIDELIQLGVRFDKDENGYSYTREGGHSIKRIMHYKDSTGKEITSTLLKRVSERPNIEIVTKTTMVDILDKDNRCYGIVGRTRTDKLKLVRSRYVILATGGLGGIYEHTTNFAHITGDAISIALRKNIKIKDLDYIQIHPTSLYSEEKGRRFLISESVRGEGAVLLNRDEKRFVDELLPRDKVTKAIHEQMKEDDKPYVWLSMKHISRDIYIPDRFPTIHRQCWVLGYRPRYRYIPVVPAQHYLMGGIESDKNGHTSMNNLYAVGETANIGIHGANRLASNSLLEGLVFAKRAAQNILDDDAEKKHESHVKFDDVDLDQYKDADTYERQQRELLLKEIERAKKRRRL
jgi:L-aspartate oxidase